MELPINQIIQGDCLEVLKTFPDKSVDLVVTSPPYNTGNHSLGYHPKSTTGDKFYDEYDDNKSDEEYGEFIGKVLMESLRVGRYVFWNMQMLSNNKYLIIELLYGFSQSLKDIFIWEKQAVSQIIRGRMAKGYEFVFCFGRDSDMTFDPNNFPGNGYVPNIQTWYKKNGDAVPEHHATFPIELPNYFIKNFSIENNLILDPFLGSGTTAVAAKQLKRNYIGIEISERYCQIARERVRNAQIPFL